jgi:hypothetical protein
VNSKDHLAALFGACLHVKSQHLTVQKQVVIGHFPMYIMYVFRVYVLRLISFFVAEGHSVTNGSYTETAVRPTTSQQTLLSRPPLHLNASEKSAVVSSTPVFTASDESLGKFV